MNCTYKFSAETVTHMISDLGIIVETVISSIYIATTPVEGSFNRNSLLEFQLKNSTGRDPLYLTQCFHFSKVN